MTTLVTGATGFLGRRLTRALLDQGRKVRCLVRPLSDTSALLASPRVEIATGSLDDPDWLAAQFRDVDAVYDLAVDYAAPSIAHLPALTELAARRPVRRFVYVSRSP